MKKKFIVTVTAVFGAFLGALCMAACNKDKGNGGDEPDGPDEPTGVTYTVVFDANGGKFDAEFEIDGEEIDDGAVISSDGKTATYTVTAKELDEPLRLPERSQYAFSGWAKDEDGEVLWNFESDELEGDTTLYAVWATSFDFVRTDDGNGYIVRGIGGLSGDVEVPETHNGKPVTGIAKDAFKNSRSLTGIIIPDSVTEIGTGAFKNATKLESATIGEGVTVITNEVFCDCSALVELGLPKSLEKIEYDAFGADGTRSLLEVKYAGSVDDWCGIDMDCSSDKKANPLSNGKAELYINGRAVNEITVNAETVERWAFCGCKTIDSVTIGKNVKTIGEKAFYQSEIKRLDFAADSALESIGESAFETNHMTTLTLPNSPVVLGESAFKDCYKLTALDLGGAVVLNDHAFDNCFMLSNINLRSAEYLGAQAFMGNSVINEEGALSSVVIPATTWYIGDGCFADQPALSSVTFESSATWKAYALRTDDPAETVTTANLSGAATARKLKETRQWIRLAGTLTTSGSTVTGVASTDGIGMLEVPKGVTKINANAFKDFKGLRYLTIEQDVTEIGDGFIDGCDNLMTVSVSGNNNAYGSTGSMLYKKGGSILWINPAIKSTKILTIPSGVKSIPSGMFAGMDIFSLTMPASVTEIADGAFEGSRIEQAEMPASAIKYVKNAALFFADITSGTEIEAEAFKDCASLEGAALPLNLTTIGARAFENCGSLTSLEIPNGVTSIGQGAFAGCAIVLETEKTKAECAWSYDGVPVVYDRRNNGVADDGYVYTVIDGIRYALKDGKATVAKQSSKLTAVKIPASVEYGVDGSGKPDVYEVIGIADGAFDGCEIDSIAVASGNSNISVYKGILYNADKTAIVLVPKGLKGSVTLADTLKSIPASAFAGMTGITKITIPNSVTTIGNGAFSGCPITSATLPASALSAIPKGSLKTVVITSGDVIPDNAFADCELLESITVDENNANYSSQDGILYNKAKTEFVFIPKSVSGSVTIPESMTTIPREAFYYRESLTSVTIHIGVTVIEDYAFDGCSALTAYCEATEKPSGWSYSWNRSNGSVFWDYKNKNYRYADAVIDGIRYFLIDGVATVIRQPRNITTANIPATVTYKDTTYDVTSIEWRAFENCRSLTSVTIGNKVTSIGEHAFDGCESLTSVTIGSSVTSIGQGAFNGCNSLTSITVSENNTAYASQDGILYNKAKTEFVLIPENIRGAITIPDSITNIGYSSFENRDMLTSITIPTSVTTIYNGAFEGCKSLTSISLPFVDSIKTCFGRIFGASDYRDNGKVPSSLKTVVITSGDSIGDNAFDGCGNITSVTIQNGVTSIGERAFYRCSSLSDITIPNSVTSIGYQAFEGCNNLQYNEYDNAYYLGNDTNKYLVLVKAKNTSINDCTVHENTKFIYYEAFYRCNALAKITISASVISIGYGGFLDCYSLTDITYKGTVAQWNAIAKGEAWDLRTGNYTIHCTDGDITKS